MQTSPKRIVSNFLNEPSNQLYRIALIAYLVSLLTQAVEKVGSGVVADDIQELVVNQLQDDLKGVQASESFLNLLNQGYLLVRGEGEYSYLENVGIPSLAYVLEQSTYAVLSEEDSSVALRMAGASIQAAHEAGEVGLLDKNRAAQVQLAVECERNSQHLIHAMQGMTLPAGYGLLAHDDEPIQPNELVQFQVTRLKLTGNEDNEKIEPWRMLVDKFNATQELKSTLVGERNEQHKGKARLEVYANTLKKHEATLVKQRKDMKMPCLLTISVGLLMGVIPGVVAALGFSAWSKVKHGTWNFLSKDASRGNGAVRRMQKTLDEMEPLVPRSH